MTFRIGLLLLPLLLHPAAAACTGGTFTSAASAEAALGGCSAIAGSVELRFAADSSMAVQAQLETISGSLVLVADPSNTLRDDVCTIFPNLVSVDSLDVHGAALGDGIGVNVNCPQLVVATSVSVAHLAATEVLLANQPPHIELRSLALATLALGDEFRPGDGLTVLRDCVSVLIQSIGDAADYAAAGSVDLLQAHFLSNTGGMIELDGVADVRSAAFYLGEQTTTKRVRVANCNDLESLVIAGAPNSEIELAVAGNAALKAVSVDVGSYAPSAVAHAVSVVDNAALESLRLDGTLNGPIRMAGNGASLCCDDLDQPLLRKYRGFATCSPSTCASCGGLPTLTGRLCMPCECQDNSCVDLGLRRGSPTICIDRALEVSEEARPSLCSAGRSISSAGTISGQLLSADQVSVHGQFILSPVTLGACSASNDGQLVVGSVDSQLMECVAHLGGWLPAGTDDGERDLLFRINIRGSVHGTNGTWFGTNVGATAGMVRDRCGVAGGAWSSNGGHAATDHVRLPAHVLFGVAHLASVTWMGRVRVDSLTGAQVMPVFSAGAADARLLVGVVGTGGSAGLVHVQLGSTTVRSATALTIGEWHHIAVVRSVAGRFIKIFLDGELDATAAQQSTAPLSGLGESDAWLGRDASSPASDFDGAIDDIAVHASSLSPSLIRLLAAKPC